MRFFLHTTPPYLLLSKTTFAGSFTSTKHVDTTVAVYQALSELIELKLVPVDPAPLIPKIF